MKADLVTITEEMTGSTELAEALNKNFESLNDRIQEREDAILKGLKEMEGRIIRSFERSIETAIAANNKVLVKKLDAVLRQNGIDPNLLTEED
jgi:DNA anti-recombination protein RmuC